MNADVKLTDTTVEVEGELKLHNGYLIVPTQAPFNVFLPQQFLYTGTTTTDLEAGTVEYYGAHTAELRLYVGTWGTSSATAQMRVHVEEFVMRNPRLAPEQGGTGIVFAHKQDDRLVINPDGEKGFSHGVYINGESHIQGSLYITPESEATSFNLVAEFKALKARVVALEKSLGITVQQHIRENAYYRWNARGRELDRALDDWLAAEREVLSTMRQPDTTATSDDQPT